MYARVEENKTIIGTKLNPGSQSNMQEEPGIKINYLASLSLSNMYSFNLL